MRLTRMLLWALLSILVVGGGSAVAVLWHAGYRVYIIHTGSMVPTANPGAIVIDRPPHAGQYKPGDIITFLHSDDATDVVTHRITDITPTGLIHTKGDANATADVWDIRPDQVKGVDVRTVPKVGYFLVFIRQPSGAAAVLLALVGLALLWGLFFPETDPATATRKRTRHRRARNAAPSELVRSRRVTPTITPKPEPILVDTFDGFFEDALV
jgi:signal peptidase